MKLRLPISFEDEKKRDLFEEFLFVIFNQFFVFMSGCFFVLFHDRSAFISLLFLVLGIVPIFVRIKIIFNEEIGNFGLSFCQK